MAVFSNKEKKEQGKDNAVAKTEKATPAKAKKAAKVSKDAGAKLTKTPVRILRSPHVTEKAAYMTLQRGYVFEVAQDATKRDVIAAVRALYGVTPVKVNMVVKQPRAYVARFRNRRGTKAGLKKAYVFLKQGDKIDMA